MLNVIFISGDESDESLKGLTEDQLEIAQLGKPRLGEHTKCQITIRESKEFQVQSVLSLQSNPVIRAFMVSIFAACYNI